jgi:hypothetical protein
MRFVIKRPSRMQEGHGFFRSWTRRASIFGQVQNSPGWGPKLLGRLAPPRLDLTPPQFVGGTYNQGERAVSYI